jgi:hypothetical protein
MLNIVPDLEIMHRMEELRRAGLARDEGALSPAPMAN